MPQIIHLRLSPLESPRHRLTVQRGVGTPGGVTREGGLLPPDDGLFAGGLTPKRLCQALLEWDLKVLNLQFPPHFALHFGGLLARPLGLSPSELQQGGEIWIESADLETLALPWSLLAHEHAFLHTMGWSCSLTSSPPTQQRITLPETPRLLLLAPRNEEHPQTVLEQLLHHNVHFNSHTVQVVHDWETFREKLRSWHPHLIELFGIGLSGDASPPAHLTLNDGQTQTSFPVTDLQLMVEGMEEDKRPRLIYLNPLQGHPLAVLALGRALHRFIPAVVVGRCSAPNAEIALRRQVARHQGLQFWLALLLKAATPPQRALAILPPPDLPDAPPSITTGRWYTPLLFRHYQEWDYTPRQGRGLSDPHWYVKLDRSLQYSLLAQETRQMIHDGHLRSLAYLWYGMDRQGVALFHKRLSVQLHKDLTGETAVLDLPVRWPDFLDLTNTQTAEIQWQNMILEAFKVNSLEAIPREIRARSGGGRTTILHVRHTPLRKGAVVTPTALPSYLLWWDKKISPLLENARSHGLVGISFITTKPNDLRNTLEQLVIPKIIEEQERTFPRMLEEMGRLSLTDLIHFLQVNNIPNQKEIIPHLKEILEKTKGEYEPTLSQLQELANRVWAMGNDAPPSVSSAPALDPNDY